MYRHHIYEKHGGPKSVELKEIGPRFEMRLYQVSLMPIRSLFPAHKSPCHQVRKGFHNVIDISNWQNILHIASVNASAVVINRWCDSWIIDVSVFYIVSTDKVRNSGSD
jgi:hypothetical protein